MEQGILGVHDRRSADHAHLHWRSSFVAVSGSSGFGAATPCGGRDVGLFDEKSDGRRGKVVRFEVSSSSALS